jgi:RNAse (barnase) inhibitor barstar
MTPMAMQLKDAQHSGAYQLVRGVEDVDHAAREAGLAIFRIDLSNAHDKKGFLAEVAKALSFPAWFGANWDALNDCLTDLDWLSPKTGYVLVFEKGEHFGFHHKEEFDRAADVLHAASEYWRTQGRPFWAFIESGLGWDSGLPKWPAQ